MERKDPKLREIWGQKSTPVVYRQEGSNPLLVRLPYAEDNRAWLRRDRRKKPEWHPGYGCWKTPRVWFEDIIRRSLFRFGSVYVIQTYKEFQKCAPACWHAEGIDCECSCMGLNHGSGNPSGRWYVISDTCAVQWSGRRYSCRLIKPPNENRSFS